MKLSIITINYNNKTGLQRTIDSVICQTWRDFEWIIIDGGSTDGSKELIEQYQDHFAYWCSEPDKGVYNAMNKGIAKAKGDYLQFLNSGDALHNEDVLFQVFEEGFNADIFYGDLNLLGKNGFNRIIYPDHLTFPFFLSKSIGHPSSFIKTSLLKERNYSEKYKIVSDWYRFMEFYLESRYFSHINLVIVDFDNTGISSTNHVLEMKERNCVLEELLGKKNKKWITDSVMLQGFYEEAENYGYLQIRDSGGWKMRVLYNFIKLLKKF